MERIDLFKAFYTQESKYYADKLNRYEQGSKYSFNFWAGLLGLIWFCYRKMYVQAIILFLLTFVLGAISGIVLLLFIPDEQLITSYNNVIIWTLSFVILGFLGNTLYIKKSKKIVEELIARNEIEDIPNSMATELREKGGTSMTAALICVGILTVIQILSKLSS